MQPLIYDVAVSIDGYISGPDEDISGFAHEGPVVDDYRARLTTYSTAIMGRRAYCFGYRFGLQPGENPYPTMRTLVFSSTLRLPDDAAVERVDRDCVAAVRRLKREAPGPIYLCGGGAFAGAMLAAGLIDRLVLKRAPILLGGGTRLFGDDAPAISLHLLEMRDYGDGTLLQSFAPIA